MVIEARTIVGAAGAFAVAGLALWLLSPSADQQAKNGSVEVTQVQERSWTVEVKDLGASDANDTARTAANR
ncbi:MAG TPA: hypothetical protein VFO35_18580 [Steroidobacteraceae bacterium]|nr:hypothetical protein [Steroidobacteraceae bacterium]